ncbi:intron-binding protein aquarius [Melia azedarach]|uniref:Intron-binding protein aquarius n=1 Tax=Melia azedarach TaxID=155640 RepID=A0ACC1XKQ7_MELAZ|nr:intron-binding protein aquarius [Melia azedarach]
MAYSGSMDASSEQISQPVHDAMDTDIPPSANDSLGGTSHGFQSEEAATERNGPANGEMPLESRSNGETETKVLSDDQNGTPLESDLNEAAKE